MGQQHPKKTKQKETKIKALEQTENKDRQILDKEEKKVVVSFNICRYTRFRGLEHPKKFFVHNFCLLRGLEHSSTKL